MNINKKINQYDWKNFIKWVNDEQFTFGNKNFYTGLFSINSFKIDKHIVDFYIYNKFILEKKYELDWPEWLIQAKGKDIFSWLENLFDIWFKELGNSFKELIIFLKELREYKINPIKDYNKEYELVKIYWNFMIKLRSEKIKNHNNWIMYINSNVYKTSKGYK